MTDELCDYYFDQEEPQKSCLLALRNIILAQGKAILETQKWGMPCFCYKKKILCYLWVDKKTTEPYILLAEGKYLNYPGLESGSRSRMKIFRVNANEDLPIDAIRELLSEALVVSDQKLV